MSKNIVLCGVGGQGTVLASKLISAAALEKGIPVMSAETIGMAQRGGSVFSHLRMGNDAYCPMIAKGSADMIIAFEPGEALRMLPYLKKDGQVVVSSHPVIPVTASLGAKYDYELAISTLRSKVSKLLIIDGNMACNDIGSHKVLNLIMLGASIYSGALGFTEDDFRWQIQKRISPKFHELNFKALEYVRLNTQVIIENK